MKTTIYVASSLDGYIARENGDIDWLTEIESLGSEEDYGYKDFIESIDMLVMGRNTFDKVLSFGKWLYGDKQAVVLTNRPLILNDDISGLVEAYSGSVKEMNSLLEERGIKHLYVDGGFTIQQFLAEGLIQIMTITTIPILIGSGIPLFGPLAADIKLRHVKVRAYANGLVQNTYQVIR